jgi:hypothetical protein
MIGHRHWYYRQSPIVLLLAGVVGLFLVLAEGIINLFNSQR